MTEIGEIAERVARMDDGDAARVGAVDPFARSASPALESWSGGIERDDLLDGTGPIAL